MPPSPAERKSWLSVDDVAKGYLFVLRGNSDRLCFSDQSRQSGGCIGVQVMKLSKPVREKSGLPRESFGSKQQLRLRTRTDVHVCGYKSDLEGLLILARFGVHSDTSH